MKVIGQPESYSEMLERIFMCSVATGLLCTLLLGQASPEIEAFLNSISTGADIGPLKGIKALYVVIPLLIALFSRAVLLHDKISNLLCIRFYFDSEYILYPLATASGIALTPENKKTIQSHRVDMMYRVFYPYASFSEPKIDKHLVRTSADNWGWFWCAIESSFLLLITMIILVFLGAYLYVGYCWFLTVLLGCFLLWQWRPCHRSAKRQVDAIIGDLKRKEEIRSNFVALIPLAPVSGNKTSDTVSPT